MWENIFYFALFEKIFTIFINIFLTFLGNQSY